MTEQVRAESQTSGESGEYIEVDVTIHGTYIGKVKVKKGAKKSEILEAIKKRAKELGMDLGNLAEWDILINDEHLVLEKDGTIKAEDDVAITQNAIVVLSKRIMGG